MQYSRIRGTPYNIYLSLLYLQNVLQKHDVDVFVPNFIDEKIQFQTLGLLWMVKNKDPYTLKIHSEFKKFLEMTRHRYVVVFLGLAYHTKDINIFNSGHCNMLIFDKKEKNIRRIEPHGKMSNPVFVIRMCDIYISDSFREYTNLSTHYNDSYGNQMLQERENRMTIGDPRGFCLSWSIWETEFYFTLKNPVNKGLLTDRIRVYSNKILKVGEKIRCDIVNSLYY